MNKIHIVRLSLPTEKDRKDVLIETLQEMVALQDKMLKDQEKMIKLLQSQLNEDEKFAGALMKAAKELERNLDRPRIPGYN